MTVRSRFLLSMIPLSAWVFACSSETPIEERTTPDEIQGVWITDHPDYADRPMEINERTLLFGVGEGEWQSFGIQAVRIQSDPTHTFYEIDHGGGVGGVMTLKMRREVGRDEITLVNQPELIWRRSESAGG
jgi:hypothetical protein